MNKQSDKESSEEEFGNYYEDYEFENPERDRFLLCKPVSYEKLMAEAESIEKYTKEIKMQKLKKTCTSNEPCEYEKIIENIIKERMKKIAESGLWTEAEL